MTPILFVLVSFSWVEISFHAEFQLTRLFGSGSSMVVETKNWEELEASLASAQLKLRLGLRLRLTDMNRHHKTMIALILTIIQQRII